MIIWRMSIIYLLLPRKKKLIILVHFPVNHRQFGSSIKRKCDVAMTVCLNINFVTAKVDTYLNLFTTCGGQCVLIEQCEQLQLSNRVF